MVFTSFVGIIFLGLDFHYYDEGGRRFRTSVAQKSARRIADLAGNPSSHPRRKSSEKESRKNPLRRACRRLQLNQARKLHYGRYSKTNRKFRSTTEPDATLVRHGGLKSRLRYETHRVVDDAHEVITAVETTTGAVYEASKLQASLRPMKIQPAKELRLSSPMLVMAAAVI
jgi:hypothetical protein